MPSHRSSTHMSDKYICYVWGIIKKLSLMAYIRMILISMIYIIVGTIFYNKAIGQYYYIFFMNMRRRASFSSREKEWDKFIQRERRHKHGSTRRRPCLAKLEHHTTRVTVGFRVPGTFVLERRSGTARYGLRIVVGTRSKAHWNSSMGAGTGQQHWTSQCKAKLRKSMMWH